MSLETIKDYLKQIKEFSDYVYLHVLGEPLLHPLINEILDECLKLKLNVQLVTNGTLLDKHLNILNNKALRKISISIHSINEKDNNNNYFDTIKKVIEYNALTNIELRFYDFDNLKDEIKDFYNYLNENYELTATSKNNSLKIKGNVYIYIEELFNWPDINDIEISKNGYCHGGIDQIAILNDGRVTLCCLDPQGHNTIGDLKKNNLKEILNSKEYKDYIDNINKRIITKELCTKCSYRLRFDGKQNSKQ